MLLRLLIVVVLLGLGGAYLAFNYLDVVVKMALEHWGPDVMGVSVKTGEVQISPRSGRGSIRALEIGSPAGFSAARSAQFGEIQLAVDPSSLLSKVIVVRELTIESAQVTYERGTKTSNIDVIQNHIEAYVKAAEAREASPDKPVLRHKTRFIIERLRIHGARVTMTNQGLRGQGVSFDLPDVELRDVGRRQGGVTASEAAAIVAGALQNGIAQKVLTNMDLLRRGGVEGVIDALKGLLK